MSKAKEDTTIQVAEVRQGRVDFLVRGTSPLILNRMSEKAKGDLLLGSKKKTAAEKGATAKHDPIAEFRASAYTLADDRASTYLAHLASAFKGALRGAALDIPGAKKSQIGRLTYVEGDYVEIYGLPKIFLSVVRSADMARTPDVRTRVIVPEWAARVSISFIKPLINETAIANLLVGAGISQGVGDWRPEKGSGAYGRFMPVDADDADVARIIAQGGRAAQMAAMAEPEPYDLETEELLTWYGVEAKRRGFKSVA